MSSNDELCIYCNGSKPNDDELQLVGAYRKDALETLVANATALEMHALLTNINEKKTYISISFVVEYYIIHVGNDQVPLMMRALEV